MNPICIGIAGGTGSGKTTLVNRLTEELGDEVITLCHDYYYLPHDDLTLEDRKKLNYDHPNSFETKKMIEDIQLLKQGVSIERPVYDFIQHTRAIDTVHVEPRQVILVEGILLFENKALRNLLDIKVFVDTDADVRIIRRIVRDVKTRGRSLDSVIDQYLSTVKVMHEDFVEPSKKHADIIIPEGGHNQVAINMLLFQIKTLLKGD
ncbi:uridine kinase [Clostridia bacterium]|nr:uridine kinase [Clostridia bacterium]